MSFCLRRLGRALQVLKYFSFFERRQANTTRLLSSVTQLEVIGFRLLLQLNLRWLRWVLLVFVLEDKVVCNWHAFRLLTIIAFGLQSRTRVVILCDSKTVLYEGSDVPLGDSLRLSSPAWVVLQCVAQSIDAGHLSITAVRQVLVTNVALNPSLDVCFLRIRSARGRVWASSRRARGCLFFRTSLSPFHLALTTADTAPNGRLINGLSIADAKNPEDDGCQRTVDLRMLVAAIGDQRILREEKQITDN